MFFSSTKSSKYCERRQQCRHCISVPYDGILPKKIKPLMPT